MQDLQFIVLIYWSFFRSDERLLLAKWTVVYVLWQISDKRLVEQ